MKKLLTDLILKFTFGKLEPMQNHIRDVVEDLVFWSFYIGLITGVLIFFIIYLIAN